MTRAQRIASVASSGVAILWTLAVIVPFVLMLLLSFRTQADIIVNPWSFTSGFVLENFQKAWVGPLGGAGFAGWAINSAIVVLLAVTVNTILAVPAAYFSVRLGPREQAWFVRFLLVALVIPLTLLLIPVYQIFSVGGLVGQPVAVGIFYGLLCLPTSVLVLRSFFIDFPREISEAAAVDGLSDLGTLARVVLPLSKGVVFAVALLTFLAVWGESAIALVLLPLPEGQTIAVGLLGFRTQWGPQLGPIFAGLSLASIPALAIYLIFNKYVSQGIVVSSSVK